jgi:hypothetical protein
MRIMIPPIPPFVIDDDFMDNDENDGGWDEDDDFIAAMEAGLERDVEVEDFALQFLNELERDLLSDLPLGDTSLLFDAPPPLASNDDDLHLDDLDDEYNVTTDNQQKRVRGNWRDGFEFGNLFDSCWYRKFLASDRDGVEGTRSRTRRLSGRDRQGIFRSTFRLPLAKVESLALLMINKNIIFPTRRIKTAVAMQIKAELHVLGALCILGHGLPFGVISAYSNISKEEHRLFFHKFINYFFDHHQDYFTSTRCRGAKNCFKEISWGGTAWRYGIKGCGTCEMVSCPSWRLQPLQR